MTHSVEAQSVNSPASLRGDPKRLGRMIFGALFLAIFIGYYIVGRDLPTGTLNSPGAGMFPGWLGIAGIAISLIVIIEALSGKSEAGEINFPRGRDLRNLLLFFGLLVAYVLTLPVLGQYIGASLFAVTFIRFVGGVSWVKSLVIGLAMALILSYFFSEVLGLPLPSGTILP